MYGARRGWLHRPLAGAVGVLVVLGLVVGLVLVSAAPAAAAKKPCPAGLVALTFDDGPSPTQTPRLVRILRERRVPATFFMVGQRVRSAPAVARMVQRNGFGIANHTWAHPLLTSVSNRAVRDQLVATDQEMRRHGLRPGRLMRPPYGGINARVRRDIGGTRMVPVLWSVDSRDWAGGNARQIADRILAGLRPHGQNVVLQHDGVNNSAASVDAVPLVVTEARRRGYCFTALDDRGRKVYPVPRLGDVRAQAPQERARPRAVPAEAPVTGTVLFSVTPVAGGTGIRFGMIRLPQRAAATEEPLAAPRPGATSPATTDAGMLSRLLRALF